MTTTWGSGQVDYTYVNSGGENSSLDVKLGVLKNAELDVTKQLDNDKAYTLGGKVRIYSSPKIGIAVGAYSVATLTGTPNIFAVGQYTYDKLGIVAGASRAETVGGTKFEGIAGTYYQITPDLRAQADYVNGGSSSLGVDFTVDSFAINPYLLRGNSGNNSITPAIGVGFKF